MLRGRWCRRSDLSSAERDEMFALLDRHFLGVTRSVFERDLDAKDYAVLLSDEAGRLQGFTGFALVPFDSEPSPLWVLYSGDTIVDRSAWGSFALAQTWIDAVRTLRAELGEPRLLWLLICSGPRTYRFLSVFFRCFYPRFDAPAPLPVQRLLERLARERYGAGFDSATGIVRLPHPQPLRPEIREAPGVPRDDHVRHFERRNPGWIEGDELVCLADLDDRNLTAAGRRMARVGRRAGRGQNQRLVNNAG